MSRNFPDWLKAFTEYASYTESPKIMHLWAGVGTLAGALRRKVWFDQIYFKWYPSFYIVFVAPPGIVSKSTTADIGMDLLREVPGIKFGPDSVTWQQLVVAFGAAQEAFELNGEWHTMSPLTLIASEFGNLIDFQDSAMVNLFITLWDGRVRFEKQTKTSGSDMVEAPWINMLACTTPHWISENMSANTIGGGFTSRCIFVYADKKERYVPLLDEVVPKDIQQVKNALIADLEHVSMNLCGPYIMTPTARLWMKQWYEQMWAHEYKVNDEDYVNGYMARKQTHLTKLAMILSASRQDALVIEEDDFLAAAAILSETELGSTKVFSRIGKSEESLQVDKVLNILRGRGDLTFEETYRLIHAHFPDGNTCDNIIQGISKAGYISIYQNGGQVRVKFREVLR